MRQSGLPPHAIKQLKIENVEMILDPDTPTPCKVSALHKCPNFMGEEGIKYLKKYLATRKNLTLASLLFTIRNNPNKEINTKSVSRAFKLAMKKARIGKPEELKLYSLIKFYKDNAKDYRKELADDSTPKEDESHRDKYKEKAMPFLEIEPPSPMDIRELKKQLREIQNFFPKEEEDEYGEYLEKHPEEAKLRDEELERVQEKSAEHETELHIEYLKERVNQLENTLEGLQNRFIQLENIIKKRTKRRHVS